jgi:hypothetical protein
MIPVHTLDNYGPGNSILVSGSDVYIAGMNESAPPPFIPTAAYWKNGNLTLLPRSEINSFANSIFVSANNVFVAGYETDLQVSSAVYWKDSIEAKLTDGIYNASANSIFVK